MPFQAWIPVGLTPGRSDIWKLQWGHALSGMDTVLSPSGLTAYRSFNGAMPFQAWIQCEILNDLNCFIWLQWGHALSGMDTTLTAEILQISHLLQWGHALSGMDTAVFRAGPGSIVRASMGPCPFRHGYREQS